MDLQLHHRLARILFWFAQIIGMLTSLFLVLFIGGNFASELFAGDIGIREDYLFFLFFLCELLVAGSIILSWHRKRLGPALLIAFTILIGSIWGNQDINIILLHLPLLLSGILLLFYSYYKERILKKQV
jgi:hypothetical protein